MTDEARVNSIPALRQLRASLMTFADIASVAVEEANGDIQRMLMWLRDDRYRYWKKRVQVCTERYTQAMIALKGRQVLDRALAGSTSSCVDEKKAVQVAERKLREAEHKLRSVKTWTQQIEKELSDYRGAVQTLVNTMEVDLPNACARLDRMVDSLDAYVALAPPEMARTTEDRPESSVLQPPGVSPTEDDAASVPAGPEGTPDERDDAPKPEETA